MSFSVSAGTEDWVIMLMVATLLGSLFWLLRTHRLGEAAHHWAPVKATLLEVHIKTRTDEDCGEESAPHVAYQYTFRGRTFTSQRVQYGDLWTTDYTESCALVRYLHTGDEIEVRVNPQNPKQVVLIPGYHGHLVGSVGLIGLSIVVLLVFF